MTTKIAEMHGFTTDNIRTLTEGELDTVSGGSAQDATTGYNLGVLATTWNNLLNQYGLPGPRLKFTFSD